MKKSLIFALALAIGIVFTFGCGGMGGQVKGKSFKTEGWIDGNTYRTTAVGSPGRFKARGKMIARNAAKEAARLLAVNNVLKKFKGEKIEAASGMSNFEMTGIAVSSETQGVVKGGSIVKETYDEDHNCEIVYEVKAKGLRKKVKEVVVK